MGHGEWSSLGAGDDAASPSRCRPVEPGDLAGIARIEAESFGELAYPYFALRQLFDLHSRWCMVAETDGILDGHILAGVPAQGDAWLIGLAVRPACRGRGIASRLIATELDRFRAADVKKLMATVEPDNHVARELYRQFGFATVGYEDDYFGTGEPREILSLIL